MSNIFNDGNQPVPGDQIGQTLQKILGAVLNNGAAGVPLYVSTIPSTSAAPGVAGNYAAGGGNFYFYDSTSNQWLMVLGSTF